MSGWTSRAARWCGVCLLAWTFPGVQPAGAIEVRPTDLQVQQALERGRQAAASRTPPDQLYAWFGSGTDLQPRGFLMTKLAGVAVMSAHFSLRAERPTAKDVLQILSEPTLLISVLLFGDRPDFAVDSYVLLQQGSRAIKPVTVRFDARANRSSAWPRQPAYRAKVVASFAYEELDPKARTVLSVFPGGGQEVRFDVDFATFE